jgi:hypothetical protein
MTNDHFLRLQRGKELVFSVCLKIEKILDLDGKCQRISTPNFLSVIENFSYHKLVRFCNCGWQSDQKWYKAATLSYLILRQFVAF